MQQFRTFLQPSAIYSLAYVSLPDKSIPVVTRSSSPSAYDEMADRYGYHQEKGAGMGKIRLSLVKLGCYMNVDAPVAVSPSSSRVGVITNECRSAPLGV